MTDIGITMQFHNLGEEVRAYRDVVALTSLKGVPHTILDKIKRCAIDKWPPDYGMQLQEINERLNEIRDR